MVTKCEICGEPIDLDNEENDDFEEVRFYEDFDKDGDEYFLTSDPKLADSFVHSSCLEEPDGKVITKNFSYPMIDGIVINIQDGESNKQELEFALEIAKQINYKHTDAWRGYYNTPNIIKVKDKTFIKIVDSYTGRDDITDLDILDFSNKEKYKLPTYYIVTTVSSNVFNTGVDIFVEKKNAKEFAKKYTKILNDEGIKHNDLVDEYKEKE